LTAAKDPVLLMWFIRRRLQVQALRRARTVVRFGFLRPRRSFWLRIEPPAVDLCFTDEASTWSSRSTPTSRH
jgi:hypothetical protein